MSANGTYRLWETIKRLVDSEIDKRTRSCCRMKKMTVVSAYDESTKTVRVQEAFGQTVELPIYGNMDSSKLVIGQSVWVLLPCSSMSNAFVFMLGDISS